jgi:hypothetical protein
VTTRPPTGDRPEPQHSPQFWHLGAGKKKADREAQEAARHCLHQKLFPSDSADLESDG